MKINIGLIKSFWQCLTSVGMDVKIEDKDKKYVKFTNVIAVLTAIAVFGYIPFSIFQKYYLLAALQGLDVCCVLCVVWFNHLGYNKVARHTYILVINSFVLINSCFIGFESHVHDFFYIAYIVPFLLFGVKDYKNILVGVFTSILFFNIYQSIYPYFIAYNLDGQSQHLISNINLWMKFILFGIAIYILSYYNQTTEAALEASNDKLQKQAEELYRSNSDLEQFAAIISHDLKAPVRNVSSFMTILSRRYADRLDKDGLNFIELSKNSSDRMARQIDDLLEYSKLARNLPPAGIVDVDAMIRSIQIELGEKLIARNARVIVLQPLPILRNVHSSMLHHVFQNLIANGVKFNKNPKPEIMIDYSISGQEYMFSVKDNGIGIDQAFQDKLFHMFKRLHTDSEFEGSGIGLAVCKKIINYYGGKIWFESEHGQGTRFYFTIRIPTMDVAQVYTAQYSSPEPGSFLFASS